MPTATLAISGNCLNVTVSNSHLPQSLLASSMRVEVQFKSSASWGPSAYLSSISRNRNSCGLTLITLWFTPAGRV
jgi:hypothetical protein